MIKRWVQGRFKADWPTLIKEFLLLFLAVFLGYLAENQLESNHEQTQAKELAMRFYHELKEDSVAFETAIAMREARHTSYQFVEDSISKASFLHPSQQFSFHFTNSFLIYGVGNFRPQGIILEQVRSSGSQAYFQKGDLQKLTGELAKAISSLEKRNEVEYVFFDKHFRTFMVNHFDARWIGRVRLSKKSGDFLDKLKEYVSSSEFEPPRFFKPETIDIEVLSNTVTFRHHMSLSTAADNYAPYQLVNAKLLQELRKEYRITD